MKCFLFILSCLTPALLAQDRQNTLSISNGIRLFTNRFLQDLGKHIICISALSSFIIFLVFTLVNPYPVFILCPSIDQSLSSSRSFNFPSVLKISLHCAFLVLTLFIHYPFTFHCLSLYRSLLVH